jgi:hypothetical protein
MTAPSSPTNDKQVTQKLDLLQTAIGARGIFYSAACELETAVNQARMLCLHWSSTSAPSVASTALI